MRAQPGDELIVRGRREGDGDRHGEVVEVEGPDGAPPYLIRWWDGHESMFFPASGIVIEHHHAQDAGSRS